MEYGEWYFSLSREQRTYANMLRDKYKNLGLRLGACRSSLLMLSEFDESLHQHTAADNDNRNEDGGNG